MNVIVDYEGEVKPLKALVNWTVNFFNTILLLKEICGEGL